MMIVKKHFTPDRRLVLAICDEELLGRKIEDNELLLDLSSAFYDGEALEEEAVKKLIRAAYILNVVGTESVNLVRAMGLDPQVILVDDTPHVQMVLEND